MKNAPFAFSVPRGAIARIWRARATPAGFAAYHGHVMDQVFPALAKIPGFRGGCVLRENFNVAAADGIRGEAGSEVQVITFWESFDAIRAFAGTPSDRAVVEPEARTVLSSFDEFVRHFTIAATISARADETTGTADERR
jgi:heme-degrading monooxygenase HmoA